MKTDRRADVPDIPDVPATTALPPDADPVPGKARAPRRKAGEVAIEAVAKAKPVTAAVPRERKAASAVVAAASVAASVANDDPPGAVGTPPKPRATRSRTSVVRTETPASAEGAAPRARRGKRAGLPARDERSPDRQPGDEGARLALVMARRVVDLAADKKAADIVLIAVGELTTIADYLVICSGGSERQLGAIADGIAQGLKEDGITAIGREGESSAHWVLMDFGSVIVHVFAQPERDFYQLEKLWSDAPMLLRVQ